MSPISLSHHTLSFLATSVLTSPFSCSCEQSLIITTLPVRIYFLKMAHSVPFFLWLSIGSWICQVRFSLLSLIYRVFKSVQYVLTKSTVAFHRLLSQNPYFLPQWNQLLCCPRRDSFGVYQSVHVNLVNKICSILSNEKFSNMRFQNFKWKR